MRSHVLMQFVRRPRDALAAAFECASCALTSYGNQVGLPLAHESSSSMPAIDAGSEDSNLATNQYNN